MESGGDPEGSATLVWYPFQLQPLAAVEVLPKNDITTRLY